MSPLAAAACFGLPLVVGALFLRAIGLRPESDRLAFAGWAWCAGAFWTALVVLGWAWSAPDTGSARAPTLLVLLLGAGFWLAGRRVAPLVPPRPAARLPLPRARRAERAFFGLTTALVVAASLARVLLGTLRPVVEDDEANFWALKAQMLFVHHGFSDAFAALAQEPRLYNADYPMQNPCLQLWTFVHAGELLHVLNRLPIQLFGPALALVLAAALRRVVRPGIAALLLVCATTVFEFTSQLQRAHGDLMVALGALVACDAWLRWNATRQAAWGRLAAFGLAFLLFSKNEGQLFLAATLAGGLVVVVLRRPWERKVRERHGPLGPSLAWAWALLPLGILLVDHAVNARLGWVSGFMAGAERDASFPSLLLEQFPARALPVASYYANELLLAPLHTRGLLLSFLALGLCFPLRLARTPLLLPGLVVLAVYAGTLLVFVGAPHDLAWHLATAAQRVGFQPLALVALWVGAAAGVVFPALAPAD